MATAVVYSSASGYTKQYAEWISQELNCDLLNAKKVNLFTINMYDIIIFGGCVHASKIRDISLLTNNIDVLKSKKLIVFSCGLQNQEKEIEAIKKANFKDRMLPFISYYNLPGGVDITKLNFIDSFILKKALDMNKDSTIDLSKPVFYGSKDVIKPIVEEAKAYEQELIEKA